MKLLQQILMSITIAISAIPNFGYGQISTVSGANITPALLEVFLNQKMQELKIPGLSIAIINDEQVVYHRSLGVTNATSGKKVDHNTIFEAASLSKPLFAYFAFKMVEKGVLNLDTPLCQYLPNPDLDHDKRYRSITARHVLSHTSGLPNWRYMTNKMMYLELLFDPGQQFAYSGEGYEYLANAIAHLNSGSLKDLEKMLQKEVLEPLGMNHSGFVWDDEMDQHKAYGHSMPNLPNNRFQPLLARGSGGLHSNAKDYAAFIVALMKEQGLRSASFEEMLRPTVSLTEDDDIQKAYGVEQWTLGFARQETNFGTKYSHGGNNGDFQSYFEFYWDQGIGYVYMTNSNLGDALNLELNEFLTHGELSDNMDQYQLVNRKSSPITEAEYQGISLNARAGTGIAWIKGLNFQEGIIEFDLSGENLREKSFVGIAFHGQNDQTYDCIYFRPYLFQTKDPIEKNYMVQYISLPQYDWFNLRSEKPGKFESRIDQPPAPDSWFHVKLEVSAQNVKVFVNDQAQPALAITKLNLRSQGRLGFWTGNLSGGDFANLKITPLP